MYITTNVLGLQDLFITDFQENENLISYYAETKPSPQICPHCGQSTSSIHGYRNQIIKDLPSRLKSVEIHLRKRRYICHACRKTFFEKYSFLPKYHRFTNRSFLGMIQRLSSSQSLKSISSEFSCSPSTIQRMLSIVSAPVPTLLPKAIGIDEFKGNTDKEKYQCILVNLETGNIFDILPTRKKSDLIEYFKKFPNRAEVKYFAMDMTNNYKALAFLFPNATVIADKFHYVRQVYWALDNVRKRVQKKFSRRNRVYFKHSRKLLFKDYDDLKSEDQRALRIMLSQDNDLYEAWVMKENFKYFRKAKTKEEAERELSIWIRQAEESKMPEFKNAKTAFQNWFREIINSVVHRYSNGQTEGFNNKIKVLKRNAYGYQKFENFRKRILLNCRKSDNLSIAGMSRKVCKFF